MGLYDAQIIVSKVEGSKGNIAELYHTDNKQAVLLWRVVKNGREQWERRVYKNQKLAEKALYERTKEYMQYYCNNDYQIIHKIRTY